MGDQDGGSGHMRTRTNIAEPEHAITHAKKENEKKKKKKKKKPKKRKRKEKRIRKRTE
jgi:hypothetical protein